MGKLSQMPVVLIPVHFDRDTAPSIMRMPSVLRSVVLRPFVTNDFMTGVAATPAVHIPIEVHFETVHSHLTLLSFLLSTFPGFDPIKKISHSPYRFRRLSNYYFN